MLRRCEHVRRHGTRVRNDGGGGVFLKPKGPDLYLYCFSSLIIIYMYLYLVDSRDDYSRENVNQIVVFRNKNRIAW